MEIDINISGAELITLERQRQVIVEGYTAEHDSKQIEGELAMAAICYANPQRRRVLKANDDYPNLPVVKEINPKTQQEETFMLVPDSFWPFSLRDWKPSQKDQHDLRGRLRDLQKAGAFIAAEMDRIRAIIKEVEK